MTTFRCRAALPLIAVLSASCANTDNQHADDLQAEIERLQAENADLRREADAPLYGGSETRSPAQMELEIETQRMRADQLESEMARERNWRAIEESNRRISELNEERRQLLNDLQTSGR